MFIIEKKYVRMLLNNFQMSLINEKQQAAVAG
jgi:hypothetical protein